LEKKPGKSQCHRWSLVASMYSSLLPMSGTSLFKDSFDALMRDGVVVNIPQPSLCQPDVLNQKDPRSMPVMCKR
jgi:hypothetical protein